MLPFGILYEDNHLLAVDKPSGMLSQADSSGAPDVLTEAKAYLKKKYNKPGRVYLGLVQRLDRNVSGAMLLARTSKAAARLSEAIRRRSIKKIYHALLAPKPTKRLSASGRLEDLLLKDASARKAVLLSGADAKRTSPLRPQAKTALLEYKIEQEFPIGELTGLHSVFPAHPQKEGKKKTSTAIRKVDDAKALLLEIHLLTGRFHQIRAQLAHHIAPIVGDQKYGSHYRMDGSRLCLHCTSLEFEHPVQKNQLVIQSPLPSAWKLR